MNELALFAGAGGGILGGLLLGWRTVCAVEIDAYCRQVLMQRQDDGILDPFPIWDDVRTFDGTEWRGLVDVVSAGFPCQPFSVAGKQQAADDDRNGWPATARILGEVRAPWVLLENVPGLIATGYLATVIGDLATLGYVGRYGILSAASVGAPHRRERLWIVGHASSIRCDAGRTGEPLSRAGMDGQTGDVADAYGERRGNAPQRLCALPITRRICERQASGDRGWWSSESGLGRVADGVADRVDRLKAIGNGQVSRVVAAVWEMMTQSRIRRTG